MGLNTIRSNRIRQSDPFNFTGTFQKNGSDVQSKADLDERLLDSNFVLSDNVDSTKKMQFQLSSITAGNTRVITIPDASDTMVLKNEVQTLAYKTLSAPKIDMGSDVNGDIYYRAAGILARLPIGTAKSWQTLRISEAGLPVWKGGPPQMFTMAGHSNSGASGSVKGMDTFLALGQDDSLLYAPDYTTATSLAKWGLDGAGGLMDIFTAIAEASGNIQVGARISVGGVDKLFFCANAAAAAAHYICTNAGATPTVVTYSGTAPTKCTRVGFDHENNYVLINDGNDKAATNIKRFTAAGTTLTNINSDITIGTAAANAGPGTIFWGRNYFLIIDTAGSGTTTNIQRYNKTTGAKVGTIALRTLGSATLPIAGMVWSTRWNRLYLARYCSTLATINAILFELLDID